MRPLTYFKEIGLKISRISIKTEFKTYSLHVFLNLFESLKWVNVQWFENALALQSCGPSSCCASAWWSCAGLQTMLLCSCLTVKDWLQGVHCGLHLSGKLGPLLINFTIMKHCRWACRIWKAFPSWLNLRKVSYSVERWRNLYFSSEDCNSKEISMLLSLIFLGFFLT